MMNEVNDLDGISFALSIDSALGGEIPTEMLPDSLVSELKGDEYQIMMVSTNYTIASDEINDQINKVDAIAKKYDAKSMVIGEAPCTKDLITITDKDFKTVVELITDNKRKDLFPVGRLDKDTEGLLIIANDGDMAHRLLSPKHHIDKTYYVVAKGSIDNKYIDEFKNGLVVDKDFTAMPAKLEILKYNNQDDTTFLNITIQEGKFHQIKRMFKAAGSEVLYLKRLSMGQLKLDETLEPGKFRPLTGSEIDLLKSWN